MMDHWFGVHDGLAAAGRIPSIAHSRERISAAELTLLFSCGIGAAVMSGFLKPSIGFPGSSIVMSMIPMALGLALAPRRLGGFIMGAGALGAASIFKLAGAAHYGSGAFVSLCLLGPIIDLALTRARAGWRLYTGLILAGICTNLLALGSRAMSKLLGFDLEGMRPFHSWWMQSPLTYTVSGAVAGLIAAFCFFHLRRQGQESDGEDSGIHQ
jgi:hypothetical protein